MKVLITTASFGAPLGSYWAVQKSDRHTIEYRRYDDLNYPYRSYSLTEPLKSKLVKMLSHELNPGFDIYIWLDATFSIYRSDFVDAIIEEIQGRDLLLFRHQERSSILAEAQKIIEYVNAADRRMVRRGETEPVIEQAEMYRRDQSFADDQLFNGGFLAYTANLVKETPNLMTDWYYHVCRYTIRDQISLPYMIYKWKPYCRILDCSIQNNRFVYFDQKLFEQL